MIFLQCWMWWERLRYQECVGEWTLDTYLHFCKYWQLQICVLNSNIKKKLKTLPFANLLIIIIFCSWNYKVKIFHLPDSCTITHFLFFYNSFIVFFVRSIWIKAKMWCEWTLAFLTELNISMDNNNARYQYMKFESIWNIEVIFIDPFL